MTILDLAIPIIGVLVGFLAFVVVLKIETRLRWIAYLNRIGGPFNGELNFVALATADKTKTQASARWSMRGDFSSNLYVQLIILPLAAFMTGTAVFRSPVIGVGMAISTGLIAQRYPQYMRYIKAKERRSGIVSLLPEFADMMAIAVDAGLSFDRAVQLYCEKFDNTVCELFSSALKEIALGKSRRRVFIETAQKSQIDDLRWLVAAVLQSEQLGTPLVKALREQAKASRERQKERTEELSATASVKMLFPIAGLILPSLMILIMGPAFLRFLE
ncbi:MAG TPA: type II secretion system F family protein [Actinobacteria bacterium]|nr:type II secretion system F family protein [Actinomycetota bacterium]